VWGFIPLTTRAGPAVYLSGIAVSQPRRVCAVTEAYDLGFDQLPNSADPGAFFDLSATAPSAATKQQERLMLQSLLAERFHLVALCERRLRRIRSRPRQKWPEAHPLRRYAQPCRSRLQNSDRQSGNIVSQGDRRSLKRAPSTARLDAH